MKRRPSSRVGWPHTTPGRNTVSSITLLSPRLPTPPLKIRLGTRKSALAQAQATWVADRLRAAHRDLIIETVLITTSGDLSDPAASSKPLIPSDVPTHGLQ